jgi:menaquinone-dependent protoporphyrinogen oxidase
MSRILVAFASHYGQTRTIAQRITDRLRDRGHEVDLANLSDGIIGVPPPQDYDAVVLGSRVEFGKHAAGVLAYIREHLPELRRIPTAFFSVSMSAVGKQPGADPNDYLAKTFNDLAWSPTESIAFGGALPYRRYNWLLRFIMKQISKKGGHTTDTSKNHYFTDFASVVDFTDRFAWHLGERQSAVHL